MLRSNGAESPHPGSNTQQKHNKLHQQQHMLVNSHTPNSNYHRTAPATNHIYLLSHTGLMQPLLGSEETRSAITQRADGHVCVTTIYIYNVQCNCVCVNCAHKKDRSAKQTNICISIQLAKEPVKRIIICTKKNRICYVSLFSFEYHLFATALLLE